MKIHKCYACNKTWVRNKPWCKKCIELMVNAKLCIDRVKQDHEKAIKWDEISNATKMANELGMDGIIDDMNNKKIVNRLNERIEKLTEIIRLDNKWELQTEKQNKEQLTQLQKIRDRKI